MADWNILRPRSEKALMINLKNYCESWRMNMELNNIREFEVVPEECVGHIGKYVTSTQYKVDAKECLVYLSTTRCGLNKDGKDAWIFYIDDTPLSTLPYYKKHGYGGEKLNLTSLEDWMRQSKAPVLDHSLRLFNHIKEVCKSFSSLQGKSI